MSQKIVRKPGDFVGPSFNLSTMGKWEEEFPGFRKLFDSIRDDGIDGVILKPLVRVFGSHILAWKPSNTQKGPFGLDNCTEKVNWFLFVISAKRKGLWRRHEVFTAGRISLRARKLKSNAESQWKPQVVQDGDSIATALGRMSWRELFQVTILATVAHRRYVAPSGSLVKGLGKVDISLFKMPSDTAFKIMLDLAVQYPNQPLT